MTFEAAAEILKKAKESHNVEGALTALATVLKNVGSVCERAAAGDHNARQQALELERALWVLSTFDEGPDLVLYYKRLMVL